MPGIHHVTAICGDPSRNLDFYERVLGLRLVKKTVNFDDPGMYHFYFGDGAGRPGSILTFFPIPSTGPGRNGIGQAEETAFSVPMASMGYWTHRLIEKGVAHRPQVRRFGEPVLAFSDHDGTALALVGTAAAGAVPGWADAASVPAEHAIRGLHGVTLMLERPEPTAAVLAGVLGFRETAREDSLIRFEADGAAFGGVVILRAAGGFLPARQGQGSVHHVAFRAADDAAQARMAEQLRRDHGITTTEQKDRGYFRSVYYREPGHVLFEIATDAPGFTVDEPLESLGQALKLPPFLEPERAAVEAALPEL